jgi:hypothetical protein
MSALSYSYTGRKPRGKEQSWDGDWVWFGMRGVVLCKSSDDEIRMLSVCIIRNEERKEVYAGRSDISTPVPAICWFTVQLVSLVGSQTPNGPALILQKHQVPHE